MAGFSAADVYIASKYCPRVHHWTRDEDEKLRQLVQQHGPCKWNTIAKNLEGRSEEEDERLLVARELYGTRWSIIAKLFPGRTGKAVKSRWHVAMERKQRKESEKRSFQESNNSSSSNSLPNNGALAQPHEPLFGWRNVLVRASSSSEKELKDSGQKEIPFYDFLGVSVSDDDQ